MATLQRFATDDLGSSHQALLSHHLPAALWLPGTISLDVDGIILDGNLLAAELASWTEIWLSSQASEDIANVVGSIDTSSECRVPAVQKTLDNFGTGQVDVLNRWLESTLVGVQKVELDRDTWVWTIEIGACAHDDDTGEVNEVVNGGTEKGGKGCIVFLSSHAVNSGAISKEGSCILECFTEKSSRIVDIGGGSVAGDDSRSVGGSCIDLIARVARSIVGTVGNGFSRVVEGGFLSESNSEVTEWLVDLEDFGPVDVAWVLIRSI
ncbi:hypothetical protein ACMFMG_012201 [Clarireedia jacksonii]